MSCLSHLLFTVFDKFDLETLINSQHVHLLPQTVNTTSKIVNKFNQIASLATDKRVISSLKKSGSARFDVCALFMFKSYQTI